MPLQGSWVEMWLARYCPPGSHRFRPLRPDIRICEVCFKEEFVDGTTCLICGLPGASRLKLRHAGTPERAALGRLCGPCLDEFDARYAINGWTTEVAS
jgi:hypothetical protein